MLRAAVAMRVGLERAAPPGSLVEMTYENEAGRVSHRRVRVERWIHGGNGYTYLKAWCFLRGEERTFRADRVIDWRAVERGAMPAPRPVRVFTPVAVPTAPPVDSVALARPTPARPAAVAPAAGPVRRRTGGGILSAICVGAAIAIMKTIAGAGHSAPEPPRYVVPAPLPVPKPASLPAPCPAPNPAPAPLPATAFLRGEHFRTVTGIASARLEAIYEGADENADGRLQWVELRRFQQRLHRDYRYLENETALRPDQFVAAGGGDCEDWALITCGLLRWWGWEAYVACFAPSEYGVGHAVCFARAGEVPAGFAYWNLSGWHASGSRVPDGRYVPIDYESVGRLSDAVEPGWKLRRISVPERIYGDTM